MDTVAPLIATGVRLGLMVVVVGVVGSVGVKRAEAATACGTLLTNVVTATMTSGPPNFIGYNVSYNATATVMVLCPPVVAFSKLAYWQRSEAALYPGIPYQETSVGAVVTFAICIDNQTTDSVWGVVLTDRMPDGMVYATVAPGYVPESDANWNAGNFYSGGAPVPADAPAAAWNASPTPAMTPVIAGSPIDGYAVPLYLRWTVPYIGPRHSACVTYTARVL